MLWQKYDEISKVINFKKNWEILPNFSGLLRMYKLYKPHGQNGSHNFKPFLIVDFPHS